MSYSELIEIMWLDVWGNSTLASVVLLGVFFFLSYKKRLDIGETTMVILPVLFGLITVDYLSPWIKGLFVIPIGALWGMAVLKIAGLR